MKVIFAVLVAFLVSNCFAQKKDNLNRSHTDTSSFVSFVAKLDIAKLDKDDAIYLKGYVINIGYEQAKKFNGKKIRVTGKVTIIKASKNRLPGQPIPQQREGDYKYIESPLIEIIKE
jgi:hypothetical protein